MADVASLQLLVPGAAGLLDAVDGLPGVGLLAPAHVSLGYPWGAADESRARVDEVRAAAAGVDAAEVELTGPHVFDADPRGRVLVHARLSDETVVRALAGALGADLRDVHLSLARVTPSGDVDDVVARLAPLLPLVVRLDALELTAQRGGTWERVVLAPLRA